MTVLVCYFVLRYVMLRYVTSRHVTLYYATLCYATGSVPLCVGKDRDVFRQPQLPYFLLLFLGNHCG